MPYYADTIKTIRGIIHKQFPDAVSHRAHKPAKGEIAKPGRLLWMLDEIEKMDTSSLDEAFKAARWITWICRDLEIQGLMDPEATKSHVRGDIKKGHERP